MSDAISATLEAFGGGARRLSFAASGMATVLAWRNLTRERVRFAVTVTGVVFAVVLMAVQTGLLYGFATTASSLVDRAGADIWIAAHGVRNVDQTVAIDQSYRFRAMAIEGVASAEKYIVGYADWRRPDGGSESVIMVGFDLTTGTGGPWQVVAGRVDDLREADAVMIDELYRDTLGVTRLGQSVEIGGRRARVVGFTRGIRTFTQSPYVFTSFKNAQSFSGLSERQTSYVLVKVDPAFDKGAVEAELRAKLSDADVMRTADFAGRTQSFWLLTTGAGVAVLTAAFLGLLVGLVITGQTLYAETIDRLPQYAMLRAMGASSRYLCGIIARQAVMAGTLGYLAGITLAAGLVFLGRNGSAALLLPPGLAALLAIVTLLMCSGGAILSFRKVMSLEPTSAFR
jgi:putative ABC transport system permease protein